jgi:hypothetical protein
MLNETGRISSVIPPGAQHVFQGCQGADPAQELYACPPYNRRNMIPGEIRLPENKKSPKQHEEHKAGMQQDNEISKKTVGQCSCPF